MNRLFRVHILSPEGKLAAGTIADAFEELHGKLAFLCSPSPREWAKCCDALEVASFYAKKAMAAQEKYLARKEI
jgi:hypothetical protein